jgi:hypothetical protein
MAKTQAEAIQIYYQLLSQGIDPNTAYQEAVKGMPTQEDLQKEAADKQQSAGLAGVGGTLAGVIGTKYLYDQLAGEGAAEAIKEVAKPALTEALSTGGSAVGGGFAGGAEALSSGVLTDSAGNAVASQVPAGFYASGATEAAAPTILGNAAGMGVLPLAAIAGATYLGGDAAYDMIKGRKASIPGRVILGMATGGLSEVGNAVFNRKTTKDYQKGRWQEMAESEDPATAAYAQQYLNTIAQGDGSGKTFEDITGQEGGGSGRDVWGASAFFDAFKDKGGWLNNTNEQQRELIAKRALDENLLTGSKGDIIAVNDDALNKIKLIGDEVLGMKTQSPLAQAISGSAQKLPAALNQGQQPMTRPSFNMQNYKPYTLPPGSDRMANMNNDILGMFQGGQSAMPAQKLSPLLNAVTRSQTLSPGIDKNGNRIKY